MKRGIQLCLMLCGIVVASACAREERPPPSQIPVPPVPGPVPMAVPGADYVESRGSIDLFVVQSSELALERSTARRVRDFAALEIEAHKGTAAQLSLAGRRLNLLPPRTLRPQEQQLLDALAQAPNFDAVYVRQQRLVHQQALALDKGYSARGQSATLRPVAQAAAQIIQRHLEMLAYL